VAEEVAGGALDEEQHSGFIVFLEKNEKGRQRVVTFPHNRGQK